MPPASEPIPRGLADACAVVRRATDADAVCGVIPAYIAVPRDTPQVAAALRAAAALGLAVVPRGTGTRLHWGYPPASCDLVLDLTGLDEVVEHAAGDLVVTVRAGMPLARLGEALGAAGQRLALDPPPAGGGSARGAVGRGTVGGVLATGAAGPLRLRYGTGRDLLIGITVVRADGTIARSGGRVVKNVAGYDLGKLFAGSRGTLGVITEATFRLHPMPAAAVYVIAEHASAAGASAALNAALTSPLGPSAAEIDWPAAAAPVRIGLLVEGTPDAVAGRARALAGLLGDPDSADSVSQGAPIWWGAGPAAGADGTTLQVAFWPGHLALVLAEIRAAAGSAGLDPAIGGSAGAGVLHAALPGGADPPAVAAFVSDLRQALAAATRMPPPQAAPEVRRRPGGPSPARASVVVLHAPAAVRAVTDLFGPVPGLELMRAVKDQFDPGRLLAPGRFAGGI